MDAVTIEPLGAQNGRQGQQARRRDGTVRDLKQYRLNLVQLSAEHNLVFVACGAQILVGEPSFPEQAFPSEYPLIIDSPPSSTGLSGYIDVFEPHTINNLLVHHLGTEEIVVAARDDGDVDAYLVRHIVQALERQAELDTQGAYELRPLIHINVGISAWGLAVHQEARLIAISSNNHEIRLISFALATDETDDNISNSRTKERLVILPNGYANIPCISFCNTGDDPGGRWLLTTDVSGVVSSWDLRRQSIVNSIHLGQERYYPKNWDPAASGWIVSFLDPRVFLDRSDCMEVPDGRRHSRDTKLTKKLWDMSANTTDAAGPQSQSLSAMRSLTIDENAGRRSSSGLVAAESPSHTYEADSAFKRIYINFGTDLRDQSSSAEQTDCEVETSMTGEDAVDESVSEQDQQSSSNSEPSSTVIPSDPTGLPEDDQDDWSDDYGVSGNLYISVFNEKALCPSLSCPLFYSSVRDIFLLQPSSTSRGAAGHFPITALADQWSEGSTFLHRRSMSRGCMFAHIPALGVIIVGNQTGQVLVMSCFKTKEDVDIRLTREHRVKTRKWVYGMHLEARLPFPKQEEARLRPACPLYGLAAAPMQGCHGLADERKRWRLVLMYLDSTVLSYEISRRAGWGGLDVADMMI